MFGLGVSVHLSLGGISLLRQNVDCALVATTLLEIDDAVYERIERIVLALTNILAGVVAVATLTHDDVASVDLLATPDLHAESLAVRLAAVLRTTYTFFMCHFFLNFK